jgi:hypothetical protein
VVQMLQDEDWITVANIPLEVIYEPPEHSDE